MNSINIMVYRGKCLKKDNYEFSGQWVEGDLIWSGGKPYIHPRGNRVRVENDLGKLIVMHEVEPDSIILQHRTSANTVGENLEELRKLVLKGSNVKLVLKEGSDVNEDNE